MTATAWSPPTERLEQVRAFMHDRVLPNEAVLDREDDAADALVAELRGEVKAAGLWAPHVPPDADHRSRRYAGCRCRARGPDHGPPRPQLVDALRGALHQRARSGGEPARRRRRRLPDRAEAAGPRTDPSRDALARPDAARVRA